MVCKVAKSRIGMTNLKRCPLCGSVNAESNAECFCCTWRGGFDNDTTSIQEGLIDLLRHCPEFRAEVVKMMPHRKSWVQLLKHVMRKPLDYSV